MTTLNPIMSSEWTGSPLLISFEVRSPKIWWNPLITRHLAGSLAKNPISNSRGSSAISVLIIFPSSSSLSPNTNWPQVVRNYWPSRPASGTSRVCSTAIPYRVHVNVLRVTPSFCKPKTLIDHPTSNRNNFAILPLELIFEIKMKHERKELHLCKVFFSICVYEHKNVEDIRHLEIKLKK